MYVAVVWLFVKQDLRWTAFSFANALLFATVLLVLAAICEYLACVLEEVKFRPLYFLEEELQSSVMTNDKVRNLVYSEPGDGILVASPAAPQAKA